jgi:hypothetical protein
MSIEYLHSQILPILSEVELLKGNVKRIEKQYCYPRTKRSIKEVSKYDVSGRIISKINYCNRKNPHKEYFSYDSVGNLVSHIHENIEGIQQFTYEYRYDDKGRIIMQLEQSDGTFFRSYENIVYNDDNLPIQYFARYPYSSSQFFIRYVNGDNDEKIRYIDEKYDSGKIHIIEEIRIYNDHGFLTKRKRKETTQNTNEPIEDSMTKLRNLADGKISENREHKQEYDYIDYKYDKYNNWLEYKCYLNWNEKGNNFHVKIKRKIEYRRE